MESTQKINADRLKSILDLKDLEQRQEREGYDFLEPERDSFLYIEVQKPQRTASSLERLNLVRRQTSEATLQKRKSVFNRDDRIKGMLETQRMGMQVDMDEIHEEIEITEEILRDKLLHQVMLRQRSKDPIDMELVEEIKNIPMVRLDMRRMVEVPWLDTEEGVKNPEKLSRLLKGFNAVYDERKSKKDQVNLEVKMPDLTVPQRYQNGSSKVQLLPHQEEVRRRNLSNMARRVEKRGTHAKQQLSQTQVRQMISRLNGLEQHKQTVLKS